MRLEVVTNQDVSKEHFDAMVRLDQEVWPEDDESHMTREYQESLFLPHQDGLFLAIDRDNHNRLAGYFNCIFSTKEDIHDYIHGGKFQDLENVGMHKGKDNILYLYTANIREEYRGSGCMKLLGKSFAAWLDELEADGIEIDTAYVEAVSTDGARTITKGFEMEPMDDVDKYGIGHYVSHDGLVAYRDKMREVEI